MPRMRSAMTSQACALASSSKIGAGRGHDGNRGLYLLLSHEFVDPTAA
jgi:hypothetical protein